ncbi:MFS transporter [Tsukamurella soli]|uniref:MFS transporter n=1 Tax=Tsukamurella soli TaxID=644556 RepID=UPI0031F1AF34
MFSDASHESVTSLLPTFLASTLHSGPAVLGAVDGFADALTGLAKLAGGPLAADPRRRSRIAAGGYLGTAVATAAIGISTAAWQVAVLRAVAWSSRGLRSPARDVLLTTLSTRAGYGRAFGVERAGDNAGAIVGPLLASALVVVVGVRQTMMLSIVPGVLAAVAISVAARDARRTIVREEARRALAFNLAALRRAGFARTLIPIASFEFGNVATTLLILRATDLLHTGERDLAAATSIAILLYVLHNAVATVWSMLSGILADRVGARPVFVGGTCCYLIGYAAFAVGPHALAGLAAAFALAGAGIGAVETTESATVARSLPEELRGNGFGVLGLVQSFGDHEAVMG